VERVTDVLELVGALLVVAAVAVALWPVSPAVALVGGGASLILLSALLSWTTRRKATR
jgi:uncharacterized membrane protein YkgB